MAFKLPSLRQFIIGFVAAFFGVQILSVLISQIFPSVPLLQGGNAILLMLLATGIIALLILGMNFDTLRKRETLIFIVILFAGIGLVYWKLEDVFPQIFSIAPQFSEAIQNTVGSILGGVS